MVAVMFCFIPLYSNFSVVYLCFVLFHSWWKKNVPISFFLTNQGPEKEILTILFSTFLFQIICYPHCLSPKTSNSLYLAFFLISFETSNYREWTVLTLLSWDTYTCKAGYTYVTVVVIVLIFTRVLLMKKKLCFCNRTKNLLSSVSRSGVKKSGLVVFSFYQPFLLLICSLWRK